MLKFRNLLILEPRSSLDAVPGRREKEKRRT